MLHSASSTASSSTASSSTVYNGRVDIKSPDTSALFRMYDPIPARQCTTLRNATEGIWENTPLSNAYFSRENIQIIQNGIRAGVYARSNKQYIVGEQDCDTLKVVMRSIFLQYAKNAPTPVRTQISELNQLVVDYCAHQIYGEAQGYMRYVSDASTLVVPLAPPVMSSPHDKQLEWNGWF